MYKVNNKFFRENYMPTDPQTVGQYDAAELMEVLREVEDIMTNTDFNDVVT